MTFEAYEKQIVRLNNIVQIVWLIFTKEQLLISTLNRLIGPVGRVFATSPGDRGSILVRVIPKTIKNGTWYLQA